jgi:hypothetical protein
MADQSKTYLRISIYDKSKAPLGKVKMDLDWVRSEWSIREDENCWDRVGFSRKGQFEHKDWGVLWIWDGANGDKNTMIIRDGPNRDMDLLYNSGFGSLFEPQSTPLKGCDFEWTKLTAPASAAAPAAAKSIRDEVRTLLDANMPKSGIVEPANWLESKVGRKMDATKATGCGGMPATVIRLLGADRFLKDTATIKYQETVNVIDPDTKKPTGETKKVWKTNTLKVTDFMTGWKEYALELEKKGGLPKGTYWTSFKDDTSKNPKPGDILIAKDEKGYFAHVCVVYEVNGDNWRTADGGQGEGYAIGMFDKVVDRSSHAIKGQYKNLIRRVDGWVDLESLLKK